MAHVTGQSRDQATLFPETLDDLVGVDHPVRVVDAFVDSLDLKALGFARVMAEATGRPPYDPGDLLKLYIYGYVNQLRSSRRLEREAQRNIEVLWLINRVAPSFKTIADFRKDKAYWTDTCSGCALKLRCTGGVKRTIVRSFHEDAREAMHQRACGDRRWMKRRCAMVEHPFGTMKWLMGLPRFLVRGLKKAKAELALVVLGFNLKRVINIIGVPDLLQALRPSPA